MSELSHLLTDRASLLEVLDSTYGALDLVAIPEGLVEGFNESVPVCG